MKKRSPDKSPELFGPMYVGVVTSPVGKVFVECDGERITRVSFDGLGRGRRGKQPKALKEALLQLNGYFKGLRRKFDLPLYQVGSAYRKSVWDRLSKIPYGQAITYEQLAESVGGNPRSAGTACGDNPLLILVPCHRILGKNGLLSGYAGELWRKKWLLEHEGVLPKDSIG
jgi:methylated-DNA-[protein]-cysteine S-methyltransferase